MEINEAIELFKKYEKQIKSLDYIDFLKSWDIETTAPAGAIEIESELMEYFVELRYNLLNEKEFVELVSFLNNNLNSIPENMRRSIEEINLSNKKFALIPKKEYINFNKNLDIVRIKYFEAKEANNFEIVKPYLAKTIEYKRKYVKWVENTSKAKGYDILLDEFEPFSTSQMYDKFFELIKNKIIPLHKIIKNKELEYGNKEQIKGDNDFLKTQLAEYLRDALCVDKDKFVLRDSATNVTMSSLNKDVRICVDYKQDLKNFIGSCTHEMGHALYDMNVRDDFILTLSADGASLAVHESQSRFYENLVGRSYVFWQTHFPKIQALCPQLQNMTVEDFYKYINECENVAIRIDSDELSYPIHILIRYEIEKWILSDDYDINLLSQKFNDLYKEYLGIDIKDDKEGILQDVHWYWGNFGYFPTYALGNAYACQFFEQMKKEFDVNKCLQSSNTEQIGLWLKENVHQYGASKYPNDIVLDATKQEFNPNYYITYLENKYSKLYSLDLNKKNEKEIEK